MNAIIINTILYHYACYITSVKDNKSSFSTSIKSKQTREKLVKYEHDHYNASPVPLCQ